MQFSSNLSIQDIVSFGLKHEKARVEAASYNMAIANVALPNKKANSVLHVKTNLSFLNDIQNSIHIESIPNANTKSVYEPSHPLADKMGMVFYPEVNTATEMATLVSASRAYDANIRIFNTIKDMTTKAYEIGK
ncbi:MULTISPECIES: flagellar basal body rod C-terminal domain-containing protein [Acinetobacter]|uniref:Flagellar biosynthesis protein FlgC n=3 Tax=Acinetobacter oleivorans TaxID=1148157 RepID=A0ABR9NNN6_9GAMM|nr:MULTISPECIES: flagellar basal body rod C-terminal domain-containing protein [Acinetobacter]ENX48358.1 flagellar basal-body rod protein FlgC [Acinetobacter sp. NIPH 542]MBE2166328.1 flagellar biosynthesis protein FlgC [Acinetobacter oleivorans]NUF13572.1 flagellar biosynthesis protein FlgC [Acinetobacter oleivorans]